MSPTATGAAVLLTLPPSSTTVRLRVTDGAGQVDDVTLAINRANLPPSVAQITQSPLTPTMGQTVTLSDLRDRPQRRSHGLHYAWDFGDGTTAQTNEPVVQHVFPTTPASADYDVSVTVTEVGVNDPASTTRSRSVHVSVATRLTIADPGVSSPASPITLVATVTGGDGPFRIAWDLDGGATAEYTQQPTEGVLDGGTASATVTLPAGTHTLRAAATGSTVSENSTAAIAVTVVDPHGYPPVATYAQVVARR